MNSQVICELGNALRIQVADFTKRQKVMDEQKCKIHCTFYISIIFLTFPSPAHELTAQIIMIFFLNNNN